MRIGIVGGGQLGRMLALAGTPLGMRFSFLDPHADACAGDAGHLICADYDDETELAALATQSDRVTFEFESIPPSTVAFIGERVPVYPGANALAVARDRTNEKRLFEDLDIPVAPWRAIACQADIDAAVQSIGVPAIVKTCTLGYDGKGQVRLRSADDATGVFAALGGVPLVYEGFVDFDCELSCLGVRDRQGHTAFYSLVENEHVGGMLHRSVATEDHPLQGLAEDYVSRVLDAFDYCGVLAFEFFRVGDALVANEIAPRVHNSGHWTIEAAETSQFENHLRAIAGLPLGSTRRLGHVAMYNLIGRMPDIHDALAVPGASFHSYAKKAKPGRKLGHITAHSVDQRVFDEACAALERIVDNALA